MVAVRRAAETPQGCRKSRLDAHEPPRIHRSHLDHGMAASVLGRVRPGSVFVSCSVCGTRVLEMSIVHRTRTQCLACNCSESFGSSNLRTLFVGQRSVHMRGMQAACRIMEHRVKHRCVDIDAHQEMCPNRASARGEGSRRCPGFHCFRADVQVHFAVTGPFSMHGLMRGPTVAPKAQ